MYGGERKKTREVCSAACSNLDSVTLRVFHSFFFLYNKGTGSVLQLHT